MTGIARAVGLVCGVSLVWTMSAAEGAVRTRLPVALVVHGATLTQPFGCTSVALEPFDPSCPSGHFHTGVDLASPRGTPVHAAVAGSAESGSDDKGCGLFVAVVVDARIRVLYCHLSGVAAGLRTVSAGDVLGAVGSSGLATGPHLHLEVDVEGHAIDPVRWLAS